MSTNSMIRRHVDPEVFKSYIKSRGVSIRQLDLYCNTSERTIRRMLKTEEVTLTVALDLCLYFDCNFDQLFGVDDSREWHKAVTIILKKVR